MKKVTKAQFSNSVKWKSVNLIFTKGISMAISIILSRVISPEHYGLMTIWSAIIAFGNVIVVGGLDTVLIQNKELNNNDWSVTFILSLLRAIILFIIVFFLAPFISNYYGYTELKVLIRISSMDFLCQPFIILGVVKIARSMSYKYLFIADLLATLIGGIIAYFCLCLDLKVYVLIANNIIHQVAYGIILFYTFKDKIQLVFNKQKIFEYIIRGNKVISNSILDLLTSFVTSLFMGKKWSIVDIGYYNRAGSLTQIAGVESYNVISNILLPTFSSYQNDKVQLKTVVRKMISLTSFFMFPLMFGLAVCAENIIVLLFTEKWLPAVPYLQISCVYYAMNPFRQLSMNLNYSLEKFEKNIIVEGIRFALNIILVLCLFYNKNASLEILAIGGAIISILIALLYIMSIMKELDYHLTECIKDTVPLLIITFISLAPCLAIIKLGLYPFVSIVFCVMSAAFIYVILSAAFKLEIFMYLINSLLRYLNIKKERTKSK